MKRMKSVLLCVLAVVLAVAMVGCAPATEPAAETASESEPAANTPAQQPAAESADKPAEASAEPAGETGERPAMNGYMAGEPVGDPDKTYTIGFSQCVMNHPFRIAQVDSATQFGEDHPNVEVIVTDGQGDVNKEIANVESMIARGVDAVVISSLSGNAIYPAYQQVAEAGIPLIIAASGVPEDDSIPYSSFVSTDEVVMGETAAKYVADLMGEKGNLVIIDGVTESTNSKLRTDGFMPEIAKYPDIKIVANQSAEWLRLNALQVMTNILQANDHIDVVYCQNDEMALGCMEAIKDAGREGEMKIVSMDGQPDALEEIKAGGMFVMTIFNESDVTEAMLQAVDAADGKEIPKRVYLEAPVIDGSNVDEYL